MLHCYKKGLKAVADAREICAAEDENAAPESTTREWIRHFYFDGTDLDVLEQAVCIEKESSNWLTVGWNILKRMDYILKNKHICSIYRRNRKNTGFQMTPKSY